MKNMFKLLLLTLSLTTALSAQAEYKIAVADQLAAVLESNKAKSMIESLKSELEKEQVKIIAIENELKSLMDKQEKDSAVMSEAENRKLLKEIEDKQLDYQFLGKKFQKRQQEGQQEILKAMQPIARKALKDVVEEGKYDLVLQRQAVIDFSPTIDITEKLTARINKMN